PPRGRPPPRYRSRGRCRLRPPPRDPGRIGRGGLRTRAGPGAARRQGPPPAGEHLLGTSGTQEGSALSLAERVTELLAPGGALAGRWPRYEDRHAQRALAADVARTIEHGGILLAEAPTGVGKSLGYLLPAVLAAAAR